MDCPATASFSHPVAAVDALQGDPLAVRLLGRDWVLWRDAQGRAFAAPDRCPHRGTRLSLGRVCAGELECPYHGWRFAADGRCSAIPAMPGFEPPATHALTPTLALAEAHELLWLRPDGGPARLPGFAAEADGRLHKLNTPAYAVATSAPRIVENFLDLAHFGFVHEGWLGDAGHREVLDHPVAVSAESGVLARGCQAWQPQGHVESGAGAWVAYDYSVPAPYAAVLSKQPRDGQAWRESIALFICPCDEEQSLVWFRMAVPRGAATDADRLAFQHTLFAQDQPVLESQWPRRLPLGDTVVRELHCAADRSSAAYRRYLRLLEIHFGVC